MNEGKKGKKVISRSSMIIKYYSDMV